MRRSRRHDIVAVLRKGGVGVMPTDTIYGLVSSALDKKTVERIYKLRRRNPKKPMIILIGSLSDLRLFGIKLREKAISFLKAVWFNNPKRPIFSNSYPLRHSFSEASELENKPTSVILPINHSRSAMRRFQYLHRGTKTLAFRLPKPRWLRRLLTKTGPLVAPSANPEDKPPARTTKEARKYFGNRVDFYVDGGEIFGKPSRLITVSGRRILILRK